MLTKLALISSVLLSTLVHAQDAKLIPSHDLAVCAMAGTCELVFEGKFSNKKEVYKVFMMDTKDLELSKSTSIVFEKYEYGKPFIAGLVAEDADMSKAVTDLPKANTYTSYADSNSMEKIMATFAADPTVITDGSSGDGEKKPPPKCPPDCNSYVFLPADQYLSDSGFGLKSIMELPALIPVFVPMNP